MNGDKKVAPALAGLRHLRQLRKMSQKSLADSLGVDAKSISRYETEQTLPRLSCLRQICRVLGCELWQLFFDPECHQMAA